MTNLTTLTSRSRRPASAGQQLVAILGLSFAVGGGGASAADKSGVSPSAISVPKGPGSIEGLGESFQPSLNTGTAKYSLSIALPPGVAGHTPRLGLAYEGGNGNGPIGYGWSLRLPCIQRRTDHGIPTYGEALGTQRPDTFINEMKEELVAQSDGYWFCENEGAFVRYRQVGNHWEASAPDGTRLEFGLSPSSRVEDVSTARTFCWLLERETDTRGNVIEYVHRSFPGEANTNQKYLTLVRYGAGLNPSNAPAPGGSNGLHFAAFEYEDRLDWFEDGRPGFLVRTGKRLKSIVVASQGVTLAGHLAGDFNGDGITDYLNRRYELGYLRYAGPASHWSLLASFRVVGADGATALPPATFEYAVSDPPDEVSAAGRIWGGVDEPAAVMDNDLVELIDLNADGLPDVLKTEPGGAHQVSVNLGPSPEGNAIRWAAPVAVDPGNGTAWNFDLASDRTHLADMDGDGLADLVHKTADGDVFFFANPGRLAWGTRQDMTLEGTAPPAPFGNSDVRTADVDFDKRIDVIQSLDLGAGIAYRVWFNRGNQAYSAPVTVEPPGGFDFAQTGVQIVDANGDRVPDVVRIRPGAVLVAAGTGYGRFAEPRSMPLPDITLDDTQLAQARLADINGDGLADLVLERAAPGQCWFWLNLGNYTFTSRKAIVDLPPTLSPNTAVRWADLNGNGTTDLIYADSLSTPRIQMVEIGDLVSGGLAPNLLVRIANGIGRVTHIHYAPSTRFALEDAAAGTPWPDALPFPVTVVAAVTVSDSLGHEYLTQFRYHDGYYHPVEKQFRGFRRAEQVEVGDSTAPTLVSHSYFDTGRQFDAMKGRLLRTSMRTEDGQVFSDETTTWTDPPRTLMTGTNGLAVRLALPVASVKQILERGRGTPRRLEAEMDYDQFGNPIRSANFGIVENGDRTAFDDERITITEYAINTDAWILRTPKRVLVMDETGALIARSEFFYDDQTFSENNPGAVTVGLLTLRRDWINPSNAMAFVRSERTKYDSHGNPVAVFDPLSNGTGNANQGHFREMTYDEAFHSYPVRETIHIGNGSSDLIFQASYDQGFGTMLSSIDFNSNTTRYAYDVFARLTSVIKPHDTADFPTTEYDYALAMAQGEAVVNFVETRQLDRTPGTAGNKRDHYLISRRFSDGLGRPLMTRSEAEPAPGETNPRVVVSGAVLFNARQKSSRALNPFFTLQTGSLDNLLAFENIEAPGWRGQFHENGSLVAQNLASAHQSSAEYDATLRVVRTTNPDSTQSRTEYEPLIIMSFDENDTDPTSPHFNTPMVHITDGLGRMVRVDEKVRLNDDGTSSGAVNTWTTRYEYDLNDRLTRITDSQNNMKLMRYDGLKRKTFMNDPDCGVSTHNYDEASNLIETVDAKGQRVTYTYDGANRLLSEDYHDENSGEFSYRRSPDVIYHYDVPAASVDQGDGTRSTAHNVKGALAFVEDSTGEEHTSFDARGRVEFSVKRILDPELSPALAPESSKLVAYKSTFEYDSLDRITRLIYPDNDQVTYEYNARNLLTRIGGGTTTNIISDLGYLPSAQQEKINYGNGVRTTYTYDKRARLTRLNTLSHPMGGGEGEGLIDFTYSFDNVSNIREIRDQRATSLVPANNKRRNTQAYAYDDLYRLSRVQYNLPTPSPENGGQINYRYDRLGNMLAQSSDITHLEKGFSVTDLGGMAYGGVAGRSNRLGRQPNDPPGPHALTSIPRLSTNSLQHGQYPYDASGNMTGIDGLRCTWDFLNRLVTVEDDTMRAEYRYDFTGRRIIKRVTPLTSPTAARASAILYPGRHFEVREHEQPTKYVFNGSTRVAHIISSLSGNTRIQRLRLWPGWNLISLAVTAADLAGQFQQSSTDPRPVVGPLFRWNPVNGNYSEVLPGQTMPAGTVLWVKANTNATLAVMGAYSDPTNQPLSSAGGYLSGAGLEVVPLQGEGGALRDDVTLSHFDPFDQHWAQRVPAIPFRDSAFPEFLAPGTAMFARADSPAELTVPDATLRIRYYHQDHLGSSSVMTDTDGALVEETAYYPFGIPRHEHRLRQVEEAYQFTQKERDRESGLHYFEARFLAGISGRFVSVDPKYAAREAATPDPQQLNLYAYARNNPVLYADPTGLDFGIPELAESLDEIDVEATGEAISGFLDSTWIGGAIKPPPRIKDGASFSAGFGDAISDPIAELAGCKTFGMGFGRFTRLAFGINNVDESSSDYAGGAVLSTALQFAIGVGEVKTAISAVRGGGVLRSARAAIDPLADTAPAAGTAGSRGSGVGQVRSAPIGGGGVGATPLVGGGGGLGAPGEAYMRIFQQQNASLQAMRTVALGGEVSIDSAITKMAFDQADAIWRSTYGTRPPISIPRR